MAHDNATRRSASGSSAKLSNDERVKRAAAPGEKAPGLHEDSILPTMMETDTFINQAVAVGLKAIEPGIACRPLSADKLRAEAEIQICRAQTETAVLQREGLIPLPSRLAVARL